MFLRSCRELSAGRRPALVTPPCQRSAVDATRPNDYSMGVAGRPVGRRQWRVIAGPSLSDAELIRRDLGGGPGPETVRNVDPGSSFPASPRPAQGEPRRLNITPVCRGSGERGCQHARTSHGQPRVKAVQTNKTASSTFIRPTAAGEAPCSLAGAGMPISNDLSQYQHCCMTRPDEFDSIVSLIAGAAQVVPWRRRLALRLARRPLTGPPCRGSRQQARRLSSTLMVAAVRRCSATSISQTAKSRVR